ncbi:hypothetical protein ABK040_010051 [Willaertia magna]
MSNLFNNKSILNEKRYFTTTPLDIELQIKETLHSFRILLKNELKSNVVETMHPNQLFVLERIKQFNLTFKEEEEENNGNRKILTPTFNDINFSTKERICFIGEMCVTLIERLIKLSIKHFENISQLIDYWKSKENNPISAMLEIGPFYWIKLLFNISLNNNNYLNNLKSFLFFKQKGPSHDLKHLLSLLYQIELNHSFLCGYLLHYLHRFQAVRNIDEIQTILNEFLLFIDPLFGNTNNNEKEEKNHFVIHPKLMEMERKQLNQCRRNLYYFGLLDNQQQSLNEQDLDNVSTTYSTNTTTTINNRMMNGEEEEEMNLTIDYYLDKIERVILKCDRWYQLTDYYLNTFKKPNHFQRNWIRYSLLLSAGSIVGYYSYKNINNIIEISVDSYKSLKRFIQNSILEPIYNIYSIIHYDEHKHQLASKDDLEVSVKSLERMVTDFINDNDKSIPSSKLAEYVELAKKGDISVVMETYEKELKSPIVNTVFGNLARCLLIQIQKQKVAIEQSMISIDSLMKQNELNVELIACIPGLLVFTLIYVQFNRLKKETDYSKITSPMARHFSQIERVLNRNLTRPTLTLPDYGYIYLYSQRIKHLSKNFTKFIENRVLFGDFEQDVEELNATNLNPQQKMNVMNRVWRTYKFLDISQ